MINNLKNSDFSQEMVVKLSLEEAKKFGFNTPDPHDPNNVYLLLQLSSRTVSGRIENHWSQITPTTYKYKLAYTPDGDKKRPFSDREPNTSALSQPQVFNLTGHPELLEETKDLLYVNPEKDYSDGKNDRENVYEKQKGITDDVRKANILERGKTIYGDEFTKLEEEKNRKI